MEMGRYALAGAAMKIAIAFILLRFLSPSPIEG